MEYASAPTPPLYRSQILVATICVLIAMPLVACDEFSRASFDVDPSVVVFGEMDIDETDEQTLTIINNGEATLEGVITVEVGAAHFGVVGSEAYSVDMGEQLQVTVSFSPDEAGDMEGRLAIEHNANNIASPAIVFLEGRGPAPIADPPGRP